MSDRADNEIEHLQRIDRNPKRQRSWHRDTRPDFQRNKRYRTDFKVNSQSQNAPLHFQDWVEENPKFKESTEAEKEYENYIKRWTQEQAAKFFEDHEEEEWFQNRYSFSRLIKLRKERHENSVKAAKGLLDLCENVDGTIILSTALPELDCSPDLHKELSQAQNGHRQWGRGMQNSSVDPTKVVGDEFDSEYTVYIPRIPAKVSTSAVIASIKDIISSFEATKENEENLPFEVFSSDPFSMTKGKENNFDRCAWVKCKSKKLCSHLLTTETFHVKLAKSSSNDEKVKEDTESVELRIQKKKAYPNKFTSFEAGHPRRIKHDLQQALTLANLLDKEAFSSDSSLGIDTLLATPLIKKVLENSRVLKLPVNPTDRTVDGIELSDEIIEELKEYEVEKRKLDIVIGYLRRVHLVCYYTYSRFRDKGDMATNAMLPRLRPPLKPREIIDNLGKSDDSDAEKWRAKHLNRLDEGIESMIAENSEKAIEERAACRKADMEKAEQLKSKAVEEFCESQIKMEEENRFRCLLPPFKLFRAKQFVVKHIISKHKDRVLEVEEKALRQLNKEIFLRDETKPVNSFERNLEIGYRGAPQAPTMLAPAAVESLHTRERFPRHRPVHRRSFHPQGPKQHHLGHRPPRPPFVDVRAPPFFQPPQYGRAGEFREPREREYRDYDASNEKPVDIEYSRPVVDYSDL